jgi:serine acetyltransferase
VVGAFSFVNADIPDNAVSYGIPAKAAGKAGQATMTEFKGFLDHSD